MGLLVRAGTREPRSLGIVPAALGYVDLTRWDEVTEESANPIVASRLLAGSYDAGVTLVEFAERHPEDLHVLERFGEVDTTWVVYGQRRRYRGELIGHRIPWFFEGDRDPAVSPEPAGHVRLAG